ncbi:MAG: 4Fe-4S binding protein [Promethearchaeati archaeon SRVP18_Atabeyarchaeia-1]
MVTKEVDLRKLVRRVGETGEFIAYSESRCTGCARCVKVCPMNIWGLRKGKAVLSPDYRKKCVECGSCWVVCRSDAIDFSYPDGGTGVVWEYG